MRYFLIALALTPIALDAGASENSIPVRARWLKFDEDGLSPKKELRFDAERNGALLESIIENETFGEIRAVLLANWLKKMLLAHAESLAAEADGAEAKRLKAAVPIDREALVKRHHIIFTGLNPAEIPQVGNGEIAFGIDSTGLQTFYGITLAQWGWDSTVPPVENPVAAFEMLEVQVHGHTATYPVSKEGQQELCLWQRENPHRLNLAARVMTRIGAAIPRPDNQSKGGYPVEHE